MKASTRKGISLIAGLIFAFVIFVVAVRVSPIGARIRFLNEWSAIRSLEMQIEERLKGYYAEHDRYPDSLHLLHIDYSRTDQATPAQLDGFRYRVTDTGYELSAPAPSEP